MGGCTEQIYVRNFDALLTVIVICRSRWEPRPTVTTTWVMFFLQWTRFATAQPHEEELRTIGIDPKTMTSQFFKRERGCRACEGVGYHGRTALFELLEMDPELRELCFRGEPLDVIRRAALASGRLRPLIIDGARKVLRGMTTVTEVLRVCRDESAESVSVEVD